MLTRMLLLFFMLASPLAAEEQTPPPPPPLPEEDTTAVPEPEVRIIHKEDRIIEEYSINGRIRYVKITPKHGPPYYFVDTDGDGDLDTRYNDLDNPPINQWLLFQW